MSLDVTSNLSSLSTATYHLKLIDQKLEQLKDPNYTPSLLVPPPPSEEAQETSESTKIIQVALSTIFSLTEHLKSVSPMAQPTAPKIFKNVRSELNNIEEIMEKLPSIDFVIKDTLDQSINTCKHALDEAERILQGVEPEKAQESLGLLEGLAKAANLVYSCVDTTADLDRINKLIFDYQAKLQNQKAPLHFADTVSQFVISYLEEEILHVTEREASLRPSFLEFFFDGLYTDTPKENSLCTLFKKALEENKPLIKATIELNILKGLSQTYSTLQKLENKPLLLDLIRISFHGAIESVAKEEEARKIGGTNPLTLDERNLLLSGTFQKHLVDFVLDLALPKGAVEIELPTKLSEFKLVRFVSDLGLPLPTAQAETYVKTTYIWPLVQKGFGNLFQSIFSDLSTDEDVKNQILIEGYEQINAFLKPKDKEEDLQPKTDQILISPNLDKFSKYSALAIGIVTVFFNFIVMALRRSQTTVSDYPKQQQLNDDLFKAMGWLAEGSKMRQFFFHRYGQRFANSAGTTLTNALKTFQMSDFLNQQLDLISKVLDVKNIETLFPKTEMDAQATQEAQKSSKEENRAHLEKLRDDFRENIDGLMTQARDILYPKGDKEHFSKIHLMTRQFLRSCLLVMLRFISKVVKLKQHIGAMEQRLYETVRRMDQDQILMAASRESARKIRKARKKVV